MTDRLNTFNGTRLPSGREWDGRIVRENRNCVLRDFRYRLRRHLLYGRDGETDRHPPGETLVKLQPYYGKPRRQESSANSTDKVHIWRVTRLWFGSEFPSDLLAACKTALARDPI